MPVLREHQEFGRGNKVPFFLLLGIGDFSKNLGKGRLRGEVDCRFKLSRMQPDQVSMFLNRKSIRQKALKAFTVEIGATIHRLCCSAWRLLAGERPSKSASGKRVFYRANLPSAAKPELPSHLDATLNFVVAA